MLRDGLLPRHACAGARPPPSSSICKRGIRRYGYDGLAFESIIDALPAVDERAARGKAIVVHVSDGASLCALDGGRKVAMATGFDDLGGLLGTRTPRLDPDVISDLVAELRMGPSRVRALLRQRSELLGVSGLAGDLDRLVGSEEPRARVAVESPCTASAARWNRSPPHCPTWTPSCSPQVLALMRYPSVAESTAAPRGWASTSTRRRTKRAGHGSRDPEVASRGGSPRRQAPVVARRTRAVVG